MSERILCRLASLSSHLCTRNDVRECLMASPSLSQRLHNMAPTKLAEGMPLLGLLAVCMSLPPAGCYDAAMHLPTQHAHVTAVYCTATWGCPSGSTTFAVCLPSLCCPPKTYRRACQVADTLTMDLDLPQNMLFNGFINQSRTIKAKACSVLHLMKL